MSALAERTVYDTYTETSAMAQAGLTHYLFDTMTLKGAAFYERSRFDDDLGTRDFSLAGLTTGFLFDNRDEATNATRGFYVDVTAEPFYEFNFDNAALRATVEARTYFGFGAERRFVLAGRAKIGGIWGPDLAETPPDRLFFAGGGGSVRGYPFKGIGVPGPGNTLTGGRYLIEGSVEAARKSLARHRARRLPRWRLCRGRQFPGPRPAAARRRRGPSLLHRLWAASPRSRLPAQQG